MAVLLGIENRYEPAQYPVLDGEFIVSGQFFPCFYLFLYFQPGLATILARGNGIKRHIAEPYATRLASGNVQLIVEDAVPGIERPGLYCAEDRAFLNPQVPVWY
jgi:hypothetical protein